MVCKLASGWPRQFCVMNREHAVFDLVPLARSRRKVADGDAQPGLVGQFLQGDLPQSATRAVAPAAVRSDEQLPRLGKRRRPIRFHQRRMVFTAKAAVSWSMPMLTQPWLLKMS